MRGEFRSDDFARLYLWLRDKSYGMTSIREIGDFVAHSGERSRGIVTDEVRDFFRFFRFKLPYILDLVDAPREWPAEFPAALRGNFRRLDSAIIRRDTGLRRQAAAKALESGLSKFSLGEDGRFYQKRSVTKEEYDTIQCTMNYIINVPVMTDESIFRDFLSVLVKNKLLQESEKRRMAAAKPALALFTIAQMHQSRIQLERGDAELNADQNDNKLVIHASVPLWTTGKVSPFTIISGLFFSTQLNPVDWCAPELLHDRMLFRVPIEMTAEPKLVPL